MKQHNIASITAEPDATGVTFTLRVKLTGQGELVLHGPEAIGAWYAIAECASAVYEHDDDNQQKVTIQ